MSTSSGGASQVTFDIDANGIVNVTAKDKATGKEHQIRIQASGGLSESDIEDMIKDAEANAEDDKKRRELAEAKNQAEALVHQSESQLKEHGDALEQADKDAIEAAIEDLKGVQDSDDAEEINEKAAALTQALMKMGEAIYAKTQADAEAADASEDSDDDDVVDAEFEDVEDDAKSA